MANAQTERALKAEQVVRAELERVANQVGRIKSATVYLKNRVGGKTVASGTGFVIDVTGDSVLLATSRQFATVDPSRMPNGAVPGASEPEFEAVFSSGQGPKHEQSAPARLIAVDTSDDFSTGLAFLLVKNVARAPMPINMLNRIEPTEGMAYLAAGFPAVAAPGRGMDRNDNPLITVTQGGIASLVRDGQAQLTSLELDEGFVTGASGFPIVEERTGTLIGVGLSPMHSTGNVNVAGLAVVKPGSAEPIGVLIPADEVRRALAGRVGALDLTLESIKEGTANVQVSAGLVDPKGMVKAVSLHVAPADAGTIVPYGDGTWPPLRNAEEAELKHDADTVSATGRVQIALSDSASAARKVLIQTAHQYQSGQLVYSRPRSYDLPGKPGRIYPTGAPLELILSGARRASFALLGPLVDPENDCNLEKNAKTQTIKIGVPCESPRTLAPDLVSPRDKKSPLHNAPMTLTPVQGDFAAIVRSLCRLEPGIDPA